MEFNGIAHTIGMMQEHCNTINSSHSTNKNNRHGVT